MSGSVNNFSLASNCIEFDIGQINSWISKALICSALMDEMCEVLTSTVCIIVFKESIE